MKLTAVIMAGGKGSRLYPLTENTPKPLLPINNIPSVIKILAELSRIGVKRAVVTTGYLASEMEKAVGERVYDVDVSYAREDSPLGSAGGVKNALSKTVGDLLVISGDAVFEGNLGDMVKNHYENKADVTIACTEVEDTSRFGVISTDESGRIVGFCEKPKEGECDSHLVNIGIYVISREIIESLPEKKALDFSLDVFPSVMRDKRMFAWKSDGYWCDMGTLSSYLECNMRYSHGENIIGRGCVISPDADVRGSILFDGVTVEAGAVVRDSLICSGAHIGRGAGVSSGSVVGAGCVVKDAEVLSQSSLCLANGVTGEARAASSAGTK